MGVYCYVQNDRTQRSAESKTLKVKIQREIAGRPNVVISKQEDILLANKKNAEWQPAWLRAIALAWSDPKYRDELVGVDERTKAPKARAFLKKYCNFDVPEHLLLRVEQDDDADSGWDPVGGDRDPSTWLWKVKQTEMTMYIPKKPPAAQQSVALAAYEAMGRIYPFTTCC